MELEVQLQQWGGGDGLVMTAVETHPLNLMALLQSFTKLVHVFVGQGALCLEPHALHLVQVLNCRRPLLKPNTVYYNLFSIFLMTSIFCLPAILVKMVEFINNRIAL